MFGRELCFLLVLLTLVQSNSETAQSLLDFIQRPLKPKGEPFPTIPGPKVDDRVCIVGAGPAGIHMALRLKELNYPNVEILEGSGYAGGKAKDYIFQNIRYPLGALILINNFVDSVVPLFKKYTNATFAKQAPLIFKLKNTESGADVSEPMFYMKRVIQILGLSNPVQIVNKLLADVRRYYQIHQEMFGQFEGELMRKPSKEVLYRIRGSISEFLEREGLESLIPISSARVNLNMYGTIEEMGALYYLTGAFHETPLLFAVALLGADEYPNHLFVPQGATFASLFNAIIEEEKLRIRYHSKVASIQHAEGGKVLLDISQKGTSRIKREACDFVIWTPLSTELIKSYPDATEKEKKLLSPIYTNDVVTSVVRKLDAVSAGPVVYYMEGKKRRENLGVITEIFLKEFRNPELFNNISLEEWSVNRNHELRNSLVYQEGPTFLVDSLAKKELLNHFEGLGAKQIDILYSQTWEYFPRWSKEELEGKHWAVFDIQGKRNIWYAGSSVSFETVASVIEYNNLLLRQMG